VRRAMRICAFIVTAACAVNAARAELPPAETVLADLGFSQSEIAEIKSGKIVSTSLQAAHERDLAAGFAFFVPMPPVKLVEELREGLLAKVDPNTIASGNISAAGTLDDFATLVLKPDGEGRAKRYARAKPGTDLNLSVEEIASFTGLGAQPSVADVEAEIRRALLARVQAYRTKGLAGIAPYARGGGEARSVADDLRKALESSKALRKYAPVAYAAMLEYPGSQPAGAEPRFTWTQLAAHDVPTIVMTHGLVVPDGEAFLAMQRQFYVSEGFNCEQAIAGFFPAQGGTVVVYGNHTSTDQVAGFGGGAKRSIGSKLMASELEGIFSKLQKTAP
jgi:hypothetical protein